MFSLEYLDHMYYYMFVLCAVSLDVCTFSSLYKRMPFILQEENILSVLRRRYRSSHVMPRPIKYFTESVWSC